MIRYLKQEEKRDTIRLWREAFPEDSESFLEYYYREKAVDNRILAAVDQAEKRIQAMVHRNPYTVRAGEQVWEADYIVAVATAKDRRRRGLMQSLLMRALADMYREEMGFCFLMPADVRIYAPFDFVTVCRQPSCRLRPEAEKFLKKERVPGKKRDAVWVAQWMNRWLEERYRVFALRTPAYVERLIQELESEDGWMEALTLCREEGGGDTEEKTAEGLRCWWGIGRKEQRMLLTREEWMQPPDKEEAPVIMARIVCLRKFVTAIRLRSGSRNGADSLTVRLTVEDRMCEGNNGVFLWRIGRDTSGIWPWERGMEADESLEISIGELTGWLFGQREGMAAAAPWMGKVQVLGGVFLDEVV